ncbi:glycogen synthase kinase binding protein [Rhinoraja longicauda]
MRFLSSPETEVREKGERRRRHKSREDKMPRPRRESFLLLEQAVTVDSKEIDALVAKIGETLQFQRLSDGAGGKMQQEYCNQQYCSQQQHCNQQQQQQPPHVSAKCGVCCMDRLKAPGRNKPYQVPARLQNSGQASAPPANRGNKTARRSPAYHLSAQQKLEQLLSSGNLIKEAVRRLRIDHGYSPFYVEKIVAAGE